MITTLVYIHCDQCREPDDIAPDVTRTKREAEEDAVNAGWVRRYITSASGTRILAHYCPPCQGKDTP